jgi:tRNA modification GTPase
MTLRMAVLTPPGAGAIAVVGLRGDGAYAIVRDLARPPLPERPQPGHFWLRRLGLSASDPSDEVVVAVRGAGTESQVELHCHGGREATRWLLDILAARGAVECTWPELGRTRSSRAGALETLAAARTARTAGIALDQYRGCWTQAIDAIASALRARNLIEAEAQAAAIASRRDIGRHLVEPWRVVVAGAVNVGKSSLVNAIAGFQRCIVSPIAGTTRDVVTASLALDGWPVEIADTAGWQKPGGALESEGIARAQAATAAAELVLWVVDASAPPLWPPANLERPLLVINKTDLPPAWEMEATAATRVSAQTGAGIGELCDRITVALVPDPPAPGAAVPVTPEQDAGIGALLEAIRKQAVPEAQETLESLRWECD